MYNYVMHMLLFDIFHKYQNILIHLTLLTHKHNKNIYLLPVFHQY